MRKIALAGLGIGTAAVVFAPLATADMGRVAPDPRGVRRAARQTTPPPTWAPRVTLDSEML
jgi:hypothetical protein